MWVQPTPPRVRKNVADTTTVTKNSDIATLPTAWRGACPRVLFVAA
jgi:hypothetical protein